MKTLPRTLIAVLIFVIGVLTGGAAAAYRYPSPVTLNWTTVVNYRGFDSGIESTGGANGDIINNGDVVPISYNTQLGRDDIAISLGRVDKTIVVIVDSIRPAPRTQR